MIKTKKDYLKIKSNCDREIFILYRLFEEYQPEFSELQIYKEIKKHVSAEEKNSNYGGARTIPMSFGVGIFVYLATNKILNAKDDNTLIYLLSEFTNGIKQMKFNEILDNWFQIFQVYAFSFIAIVITFVAIIFTLIWRDIFDRKKIYKLNIMHQIIDQKIKELEK